MASERRNWSREETIVAFNIYCKTTFSKATNKNPLIISAAQLLGRTPSAMSMKIYNLASLDPELKKRGIVGLPNISKLDRDIWQEFNQDWDRLAFESETILAELKNIKVEDVVNEDYVQLPEGKDRQSLVKSRVNQSFFRNAVLNAYDSKCCITGISTPELLIASHIVPWSRRSDCRTDPRNGLLLNALHDRAFDAGLITVTPDYVLHISDQVNQLMQTEDAKKWFIDYAGKHISLPDKFLPAKEYLRWHNENLFRGNSIA